ASGGRRVLQVGARARGQREGHSSAAVLGRLPGAGGHLVARSAPGGSLEVGQVLGAAAAAAVAAAAASPRQSQDQSDPCTLHLMFPPQRTLSLPHRPTRQKPPGWNRQES